MWGLFRRKIPKTLSGIETARVVVDAPSTFTAGKYLKPYQGLKLCEQDYQIILSLSSRKIPKTLSGIETLASWSERSSPRRKIPKTLSGIETGIIPKSAHPTGPKAGKYLKPYQGLKRLNFLLANWELSRKIPKTLSGIETVFARAGAVGFSPENT